jgi:hypothetical protein
MATSNNTQSLIDAEIRRKAKLGVPLDNPTTQKQAVYDQASARQVAAQGGNIMPQRQQAAANQMARYGVDPALFSSNLSRQQKLENASTVGTPTLDLQKTLFDSIMKTAGSYGAMPTGTAKQLSDLPAFKGMSGFIGGLEGRDYQSTVEHKDAMSDAAAGRAISWANYGLSKQDNALAQQKFEYGKTQDNNAKLSDQNSLIWATEAMSFGTKDEALQYVIDHAQDIAGDGADPNTIRQWISESYESQGGGAGGVNPFDLRKEAANRAQKDIDAVKDENALIALQNFGKPVPPNMLKPIPTLEERTQYWESFLTGN